MADTSMSDQAAQTSSQATPSISEHEPMEVDYDALVQSDEDSEDSDVDEDDTVLAPGTLSVPPAPAPQHPISPADPLADRRPRIIDVPDDEDRARRTPTSRTATPTPSLAASGSTRPIRPLPRAFTGTGRSMPMAGSYVRQGLSASTSSTRAQHTPPTRLSIHRLRASILTLPLAHQVPTQPSQPQPQPNPQQQQQAGQSGLGQGLPPAWFSTMLRNALSQGGRGGAVFVIGPDGVPRMAGGSPTPPQQQQPAPADAAQAQPEDQAQPDAAAVPPIDLFSMFDPRPKDDPGQARRLIEGLEEIPIGLVKRHVRVEQASGEGNGACAVCFECLDDSEDTSANWKAAADAAAPPAPQAATESHATDGADQQQMEEPIRPRALVLPCGHAFHSSCLEPWFQQHTTCPNCRFDLDPQHLTSTAYVEGRGSSFPFLSNLFGGGGQTTPGAADGASMPLPPQLAQSLLSSLFGGLSGAAANANAPQQQQQQQQQPQPQPQPQPAQPNPPPAAATPQHQPNSNDSAPRESFADMLVRLGLPRPSPGVIPSVLGPLPAQQRQQQQQQQPQPAPAAQPNANGPAPATGNLFADMLTRLGMRLPPRTDVSPVFGPAPPPMQPATGAGAGAGAGTGTRQGSIEDLFSIRFDIGLSFTPVGPTTTQAGQPQPAQPQPQQPQEQQPEEEVHTSTISFDFLFGGPGGPGPAPPAANAAADNGAAPAPGANPPQGTPNLGPGLGFRFGSAGSPASTPSSQPRRKWLRPDTKGRTLRQRVEEAERALGLRCDSMSCDVAPTDDDPTPSMPVGASLSTVRLHQHSEHGGKHCEHAFHPQCLVTHARVTNSSCESVTCPVCRVEGAVEPKDWEEGERAIQAWLEQP